MNYEPIEDFLSRVKKLSRSASKDMRLSFEEAQLLALNIGELMTQLNKKSEGKGPVELPTVIDGGTFPNTKSA